MPYTPELNKKSCITLRRISWAVGKPMTKTIQEVVKVASMIMEPKTVCDECEDTTKCDECYFNFENQETISSEMLTAVKRGAFDEVYYRFRFSDDDSARPKKNKKLKDSKQKPKM